MDIKRIGLTDLEVAVANWLDRHGLKGQWETQVGMRGGRMEKGGAVIDFIIRSRMLILRVMGQYWHRGLEQNARDLLQRQLLEADGFRVVDILENNLTPEKIDSTMRLAIQGKEVF